MAGPAIQRIAHTVREIGTVDKERKTRREASYTPAVQGRLMALSQQALGTSQHMVAPALNAHPPPPIASFPCIPFIRGHGGRRLSSRRTRDPRLDGSVPAETNSDTQSRLIAGSTESLSSVPPRSPPRSAHRVHSGTLYYPLAFEYVRRKRPDQSTGGSCPLSSPSIIH